MARVLGSALPRGGAAPAGRPLEILANRLRCLRAERGFTQEEFAARAGISISFVSMLERGERSPSYETLLQLAEALDVPAGELFRDGSDGPDFDDPYFRVLGTFARENHLTRPQVDRLIRVAVALFDLPPQAAPPRRPNHRRRLPTCGAEGCDRPVLARGLCSAHYHAERRSKLPD
jgi:transcriptional regulator with XRE-family HTH domain